MLVGFGNFNITNKEHIIFDIYFYVNNVEIDDYRFMRINYSLIFLNEEKIYNYTVFTFDSQNNKYHFDLPL